MVYRSVEILVKNRPVFEQALDTSRASYRAAIRQAGQREVLGAQTALIRLDERIERFQMLGGSRREFFGKWLTELGFKTLEYMRDEKPPLIQSMTTFEPTKHPLIVLARVPSVT
ncbi:MAG: hypothetical protein ACI8VW_003419 [bacterium]|jgi:hypothetical protein